MRTTSAILVLACLTLALWAAPHDLMAQDLTLVINPRTGQSTIQNVGNTALTMDGYLLHSPDGAFNLAGWSSLQSAGVPGWLQANPAANRLSETNLLSSTAIAAGGTRGLGAAYTVFTPTQIGQVEPPVSFDFHVAGGATVRGDVLFAPANNLVLLVNPATGAASIQNQSNFAVNVDSYLIGSPTGVLAPQTWTSFADNGVGGWSEANPGARHIAETNLLGFRPFSANGAAIPIGSPVNAAMLTDQSDLTFDYHIAGGATVRGYVAFALPPTEPVDGDFDDDGDTDGRDFLVWQRGLGSQFDAGDLANWRTNFGAGGAAPASGAAAALVPEPGAATLFMVATLGAAIARRRR